MPWTSRKFWAMIIWQTVFTGLLVRAHIQPDHYVTLTLFGLGGYYTSNVVNKFVKS